MTINEYQKAAMRTASYKDERDLPDWAKVLLESGTVSEKDLLMLNGVLGLGGESGECEDDVKKHLFQGHPLDKAHLAEELGDVAWYLAISADAIGYDLETILQMNIDKLRARYPDGFDSERSQHRVEGDV